MLLKKKRIMKLKTSYVFLEQKGMNQINQAFHNKEERNKVAGTTGREMRVQFVKKMINTLIKFHPITLLYL